MNPGELLESLGSWTALSLLSLEDGSRMAQSVAFFVADTVKIFLLLAIVVFAVSFLRSYLPRERVRALIARRNPVTGHLLAGMLGTVTPFCTCSAIPLFLGFLEAGIPLGVTFTFLVASPMINEVALGLLLATFGWRVSLLYLLSGLTIAIVSGLIIGRMHLEHLVRKDMLTTGALSSTEIPDFRGRLRFAGRSTQRIVRNVWLYILIGIAIGAWIHGFVPAGFLDRIAGTGNLAAVPLATLLGIPLYSNAAGIIPLVSVLTEKGAAIGTTLAFMMAVTGLSLPEFLILRRVMHVKLIAMFAGIVGGGIIVTGYVFNALIKS